MALIVLTDVAVELCACVYLSLGLSVQWLLCLHYSFPAQVYKVEQVLLGCSVFGKEGKVFA